MYPKQTIHQAVVAACRAYGLDYTGLAKLSGLSKSTCFRYLRGGTDLRGETLDRIFDALDLRIHRPKTLTGKVMKANSVARVRPAAAADKPTAVDRRGWQARKTEPPKLAGEDDPENDIFR